MIAACIQLKGKGLFVQHIHFSKVSHDLLSSSPNAKQIEDGVIVITYRHIYLIEYKENNDSPSVPFCEIKAPRTKLVMSMLF